MSDNEYGETESNWARLLPPSARDARSYQPLHDDNVKQLLESMRKSGRLALDVDTTAAQYEFRLLFDSNRRMDAKPEHSISDLHANVKELDKKICALEARTSIHSSLIDELEFKVNLASHEEKIDEILKCTRGMFKDLDFVTGLYYIPLEDGTLRVIIIHDLDDRVKALKRTQEKQMDVERAFEGTSFQMLLLHASEVRPDHLLGAKPVIPKLG